MRKKKRWPKYYPKWLAKMLDDQDYCEFFW